MNIRHWLLLQRSQDSENITAWAQYGFYASYILRHRQTELCWS